MFIYATDETTRDALIAEGYELMKTRQDNKMWIFFNKKNRDLVFYTPGVINFAVSDVLIF